MARNSPLIAPAWEVAGLLLLLAFYWTADSLFGDASINVVNLGGPIWLTAVLWLGAVRLIRLDAGAIWMALCWFRISAGVYFGAGALLPVLANAESREAMEAYFLFNNEDITKINLIVAVGCTVVLLSANILHVALDYVLRPRKNGPGRSVDPNGRGMLTMGLLFLLVGGTIKYVFTVPYTFGWLHYILPGSVGIFGNLSYGAIFFLTAWSREHRRSAFPLVTSYVIFEMMVGLLMLNKQDIMMDMIMYLLAIFRDKLTLYRLGVIASVLILCFVTIAPVVGEGRLELLRRNPSADAEGMAAVAATGLTERIDIVATAFGRRIGVLDDPDANDVNNVTSLIRFSYVNQAAFAIHQYDAGRTGDSFGNSLAIFIPRFLWRDKPVITEIGTRFNFLATGNDKSGSGPGLFVDAYWNFGWTGVVLLMAVVGVLLGLWSRYALEIVHRELWLYFPVVLGAMQIGYRTDGYIIADTVGVSVLVFSVHITLKVVDRFVIPVLSRPALGGA